MEFHPALGDPQTLSANLRPLFSSRGFEAKRPPAADDWLAGHDESGQSFEAFKTDRPHTPTESRSTIYVLPLGEFSGMAAPDLAVVERFAAAFFQVPVEVLPALDVTGTTLRSRQNPYSGERQLLTTDILDLLRGQLPADAFCLVGVTMTDLYPDPNWNFVFGQASLRQRVGVYSFARYASDDSSLMLRRSLKVMGHEIGHMFGIRHCTYFECIMNGSNHLAESDRRPMHLGPVDLRKLMWSVGFDPVDRYRQLAKVYLELGFDDEAAWVDQRLELVGAGLPAIPREPRATRRARPGRR